MSVKSEKLGKFGEELLALPPEEFQRRLRGGERIDERALTGVLEALRDVFLTEENVLYVTPEVTVVGDIHGQILDLFKIFSDVGGRKWGDLGKSQYLFLGDYVDRGYQSVETFAFLAYLKLKFPNKIFLLRGNHESRQVNQTYGLYMDVTALYGHAGTWHLMNEVFDAMPVAAVINNQIFGVHGGLSPALCLVEQIFLLDRVQDIVDGTPIADLTWSDPEDGAKKFTPNRRGNGYIFGPEQSKQFLHNNKLGTEGVHGKGPGHGFILRSHQLAMDGWTWFHDEMCAIVWSAPNYGYKSGNKATICQVNVGGSFEYLPNFDADEKSSEKPSEVISKYFT